MEYPQEVIDECNKMKQHYIDSRNSLYEKLSEIKKDTKYWKSYIQYDDNYEYATVEEPIVPKDCYIRTPAYGENYSQCVLDEFEQQLKNNNIKYSIEYDPDDDMDCGYHFCRPEWLFTIENTKEFRELILHLTTKHIKEKIIND